MPPSTRWLLLIIITCAVVASLTPGFLLFVGLWPTPRGWDYWGTLGVILALMVLVDVRDRFWPTLCYAVPRKVFYGVCLSGIVAMVIAERAFNLPQSLTTGASAVLLFFMFLCTPRSRRQ